MSAYDYSPAQQRTMTGIGVVVLILAAIYFFAIPAYHRNRHDAWAAHFQNKVVDFTRAYGDYPHPGRVPPYVRGKVVIIDATSGKFHPMSFTLWPWLNPRQSEDVGTIVRINHYRNRAGTYEDRAAAYQHVIEVEVVDLKYKCVAYKETFTGSKPPHRKNGPGSRAGSYPIDKVRWYLNTAGQIGMDAPGPIGAIQNEMRAVRTVENIDAPPPYEFNNEPGGFYRLADRSINVIRVTGGYAGAAPNEGDNLPVGTILQHLATFRIGTTPKSWDTSLKSNFATEDEVSHILVLRPDGEKLFSVAVRSVGLLDNAESIESIELREWREQAKEAKLQQRVRKERRAEDLLKPRELYLVTEYPIQIVYVDESYPAAKGQQLEGQTIAVGTTFRYMRSFKPGMAPASWTETVEAAGVSEFSLAEIVLVDEKGQPEYLFGVFNDELKDNTEARRK